MFTSQPLDITQQGENNLYNWTYPGSPYAAGTPGVSTTLLLGPSVDPRIVQSYNQSYQTQLFMMGLPKVIVPGYEDVWFEEPNLDAPVVTRDAAAAVPNVGTGTVEQTIPVTDSSWNTVAVDHKVFYPDNETHAVVIAKAGGAGVRTITVRSYEGQALPALLDGDEMGNSGPRNGDGQPRPTSSYRSAIVQYSNTMEELGDFAVRWDPKDSIRWDNSGTTNYKANELMKLQRKYFNAIMQTILVGGGGRTTLQSGRFSLSSKGIMKQMMDASVGVTTITAADAVDAIMTAVHDNQIEEGTNDWLLLGPGRILDKIGKTEKSERLRYQVGDRTYDTSITTYEYWGHKVTPLTCNVMENVGIYGRNLANRVILIRRNQLKLTGMRNWPMFSMGTKTIANNQNTSPVTGFANLEAVWYTGMFGVRVEKAWSGALFDVLS